MAGNVWEWTESAFYPFPGYLVDYPYREYSAPWFGYRNVLKGGAWATRSRLAYNTYRNFFPPARNDVYAGFRTCAREEQGMEDPMKIALITPVPAQSRQGNRVTALRWARILKALGHRVTIAQQYDGAPYDLMVALHARRSFAAIDCFRRLYPELPLLVALTGTDLYGDIRTSVEAQQSLELATRLIILQPRGIDELSAHLHPKVRVIYQSVPSPSRTPAQVQNDF